MQNQWRRMGTEWLTVVLPEALTTEPHRTDVHGAVPVPVRVQGIVHVATATVTGLILLRLAFWLLLGRAVAPLLDDRNDVPSLLFAVLLMVLMWGACVFVAIQLLRPLAAHRARRVLECADPLAGSSLDT